MSTICAFYHVENKHSSYSGEDCMKKFCQSLRENGKNVIDFKKKQMLLLTKKNQNYIKM